MKSRRFFKRSLSRKEACLIAAHSETQLSPGVSFESTKTSCLTNYTITNQIRLEFPLCKVCYPSPTSECPGCFGIKWSVVYNTGSVGQVQNCTLRVFQRKITPKEIQQSCRSSPSKSYLANNCFLFYFFSPVSNFRSVLCGKNPDKNGIFSLQMLCAL